MKPIFRIVSAVNIRMANLWKSDPSPSKHFNILYFEYSRSKFNFLFQLSSYIAEKYFWVAFFGWVSVFLLSYQNAQNTQYVNERAGILVDNQRKILLYVEVYLQFCQISVIKVLGNS